MAGEEARWAGATTVVEEAAAARGAEAVRGEAEAAEEGEAEEDHEARLFAFQDVNAAGRAMLGVYKLLRVEDDVQCHVPNDASQGIKAVCPADVASPSG